MSQHGCPERLSNRSKGLQEDGASQPTMEVLVETLTGTAFEMTVSPSDTVFAIKSKIFRVEGIPVSQQHLLYNLKELEDSCSLRELAIASGARLRLVLGMRGGPVSTRRLPPPAPAGADTWPDIERLLDSSREDVSWSRSGCKVTVLVFRDGERVNMLRVQENRDGTYEPLDDNLSSSPSVSPAAGAGSRRDNQLTMGKMQELRRRMEALQLQRAHPRAHDHDEPLAEIHKTRSEETLPTRAADDAARAYCCAGAGGYTRYAYECGLESRYALLPAGAEPERGDDHAARPPRARRQSRREGEEGAILEEVVGEECLRATDARPAPRLPLPADYEPLVGPGWRGGHSASALQLRAACARRPPLRDALFSSSTSDLDSLKRNSRILPALSRARPREHLHLSDEGLHLRRDAPGPPGPPERRIDKIAELDGRLGRPGDAPEEPAHAPPEAADAKEKKTRLRCALCRKRLSVSTVHRCRCGAAYCAPHRYKEVHGCAYDYKARRRPAEPRLPPI